MYAHKLPAHTEFFLYLLEHYARHRQATPAQVLAEWDTRNITEYIQGNYEMYHQEALTNAFADIDARMTDIQDPQDPRL
ncbi:MAG: DUF3791 domain-containing protein [Propionibacteriaceae bacterium]|jgi:hypothetical protein|nr:DUF3791 domain-containing protein [Propionibacteriaceae bacterium]